MKNNYLLMLLLLISAAAAAQTRSNYWITFSDKNNSEYSLSRPQEFLSAKAIDRRERQNIAFASSDLPVSSSYIRSVQALGFKIVTRSKWLNGISVTGGNPAALQALRSLKFVKTVTEIKIEPSSRAVAKFETTEQIPAGAAPAQRSVMNVFNYGPSFDQANQIGIVCMHNLGYQGQGMTIAVLDAGFYKADSLPAFDSLRQQNRLLGCRDFVTGDTMVFEDYPHGMNVLSCMTGNLPGRIVGTAPHAKFWLLRTEDAASETLQEEINWAAAAEFADSVGADIINSSLGYSYFDNPADDHTYADMDGNTTIITKAADIAASKGIFVTSSAGNSGGPPWYKITAPADADSILTVGAVDSSGAIAGFSSRGPTYDGRIKPNTVAKGVHATVADAGGDIVFSGGTSFSSPITAGAVACLWQAHPLRTNMEIMLAVEESASQFAAPDTIKGYGIPDFCVANNLLTGIDQQELGSSMLTVFPNPSHDDIKILFHSATLCKAVISICDLSGRTVLMQTETFGPNSVTIVELKGAAALSQGIYLVTLFDGERKYVQKIIHN